MEILGEKPSLSFTTYYYKRTGFAGYTGVCAVLYPFFQFSGGVMG
jgi:hypothetical protein